MHMYIIIYTYMYIYRNIDTHIYLPFHQRGRLTKSFALVKNRRGCLLKP